MITDLPKDWRVGVIKIFSMDRKMESPNFLIRRRCLFTACLLCLHMLMACTMTGNVTVDVHAVNYTDEAFNYSIEDPVEKLHRGVGESVDAYSAGGTVCCYQLPKKWQPGIKVQINTSVYVPRTPGREPTYMEKEHVVEVPPYVDGKPGELWVVRNTDGTMGVVSSDYQPDHAKWPGKTKGWPVPSLAYRRERWDLHIRLAESTVRDAQKMLSELEKSPEKRATEDWNSKAEYIEEYSDRGRVSSVSGDVAKTYRELLERFSGPGDPAFRTWLKEDYEKWLSDSQIDLMKLRESRP